MADSTGLSAKTGAPLSDWDHVVQSIQKILTTPIGSRVMRREFGSRLPDMIDQKVTRTNILAVYSESAVAIHRWEPRFRILFCRLMSVAIIGVELEIYGTYFPRGHLGDYSIAEDRSMRVVLEGQ